MYIHTYIHIYIYICLHLYVCRRIGRRSRHAPVGLDRIASLEGIVGCDSMSKVNKDMHKDNEHNNIRQSTTNSERPSGATPSLSS